ncbi:MAG: hypothetical protein H0T79_24495 [Deltaproteobacteria bacterium]|nr:hypothetical protein [Deltaproteobacteria bacterium]
MSARSRPPTEDDIKTTIRDPLDKARARSGKTQPPPIPRSMAPTQPPPAAPRPPIVASSHKRTADVQAISMKTPAELASERAGRPELPKVKLRAMGEVNRQRSITPPMGNLALPFNPKEARERRWWSNTFWGAIAVIIASLVALAIWLVAGRR